MVVHDLDPFGATLAPHKADTPLVIDPDAMLAGPIAAQRLQPIARWCRQIA
jgi:hypothetical protein